MTRDLAALRVLAQRWTDEPGAGAARAAARAAAAGGRGPPPGAAPPGSRLRRTKPIRVADLRSQLGSTDLVELTDVDGELFAVVVSGDRPPTSTGSGRPPTAERALAHSLFALRREGSRRGDAPLDLRPIGHRLQQALLGPVVEELTAAVRGRRTDGRAARSAVGSAARAARTGRSRWRRPRRSGCAGAGPLPRTNRRVVLVGGPHLSTGATEVRRLAERYPDAVVLADGEATSERVLAAMDGAWLVHVAAHGTFRSDSPLLSALELDDGPLTVYDLERLARAPHRVVLSSCNSAVGAPSGADELLGVVSALVALGSAGRGGQRRTGRRPRHRAVHARAAQHAAGRSRSARHSPRPAGPSGTTPRRASPPSRSSPSASERGHSRTQSVTSRVAGVVHRSRTTRAAPAR